MSIVRGLVVALLLAAPPALAGQAAPAGGGEQPPAPTGPSVVEQGLFPKSFKIPGTDLSLGIGGYVKVDFIQDFDAIGDAYEFKTNSIAVGESEQGGRTTIHARETRLSLDLRSEGTGRNHFRAFVEGDFFGDGNSFRLRHGFGEFGPILGGQTWSTFQDISARALTVDFEGSDGEVFLRQAMIRLTRRMGPHWSMAVAVENPTPQFAIPAGLAGSARSTMPDIPGYVRYERGGGHLQVAGLVRQLRFDSTGSVDDASTAGWGVNNTFVLPVSTHFKLLGQFAIGEGTGRYIEGLSGQNLDATLSTSGELRGLRTQAGNIGYIHQLGQNWRSGMSFSTSFVEDESGLAGTTIDRLKDARFTLIWTPYRVVDVGGELLWGERKNKDGTRGTARRSSGSSGRRVGVPCDSRRVRRSRGDGRATRGRDTDGTADLHQAGSASGR